jgi:predicted site-specific integrase-resolvase
MISVADLDRQVAWLTAWVSGQELSVAHVVAEGGIWLER